MERIAFIKHKGKEIIMCDHRGLVSKEVVDNIQKGNEFVKNHKDNELLGMFRWDGVNMDNRIMDAARSSSTVQALKKYKKVAIVGIATGVKMMLFNIFNALTGGKSKAFEKEGEALEWLVR